MVVVGTRISAINSIGATRLSIEPLFENYKIMLHCHLSKRKRVHFAEKQMSAILPLCEAL